MLRILKKGFHDGIPIALGYISSKFYIWNYGSCLWFILVADFVNFNDKPLHQQGSLQGLGLW